MKEEELKAYQNILKKHREVNRANATREQGEDNFVEHIKDTATSDTSNKLKKMHEKVKEELEHIPDWPEPQNELITIYKARRMHSLGKKAERKQTAKEVLEESISDLKPKHPDFKFLYDENFFKKRG